MKLYNWLKHRLSHKLAHFSRKRIKEFLKENGLAFVIIFVGWEIRRTGRTEVVGVKNTG